MTNLVTRRDYIASIMQRQGNHRNPRKFIVLQGWNTIVDHDATYEVILPPVPAVCNPGDELYAIIRPDRPELGCVRVVEDRGDDGLFVEQRAVPGVQFLVTRDEVKTLPVPLRPLAILRADLKLYLGDEAARVWHAHRRTKREHRTAQE